MDIHVLTCIHMNIHTNRRTNESTQMTNRYVEVTDGISEKIGGKRKVSSKNRKERKLGMNCSFVW